MLFYLWVPMSVSTPRSYVDMGTRGEFALHSAPAARPATARSRSASPKPPARVRGQRCWPASHSTDPPNTAQPPWKTSTRAAGLLRRYWLSLAIYVNRLSLTFVGRVTPACAGAWEDEQQAELRITFAARRLTQQFPCRILPSSFFVRYPIDILGIP